jgi:hypothetical protein
MEFVKRDTVWLEVAEKTYILQKQIKELVEEEKMLLGQLKELSVFESSEYGDFRFQRIERIAPVKYSLIPELKNIDLSPYRASEPVVAWKLFKY